MFDNREPSIDQLESRLISTQEAISSLQAEQLDLLEALDGRQVPSGDGCRSLGEWLAWKLDLGVESAREMVRTMRRTVDRQDLRHALFEGASFDRIEALSRIQETVGLWNHLDVGSIRAEAARRAGSKAAGFRGPDDRYLVIQPSLDDGFWKLWGGLDGASGAIVDKVLSEAADAIRDRSEGRNTDPAWRKATALAELCVSDTPMPAQVTVFVDAVHATGSTADTGVILETGPAIGRQALESILCDSVTEVVARAEDGRYMEFGRNRRTVTPKLHRALMDRYLGACGIDGCDSRNRLQAHHIVPWSRGGRTDQDNLVLLCWFHHHTVIHEWGYEIYRQPGHGRLRLRPPPTQDRPI